MSSTVTCGLACQSLPSGPALSRTLRIRRGKPPDGSGHEPGPHAQVGGCSRLRMGVALPRKALPAAGVSRAWIESVCQRIENSRVPAIRRSYRQRRTGPCRKQVGWSQWPEPSGVLPQAKHRGGHDTSPAAGAAINPFGPTAARVRESSANQRFMDSKNSALVFVSCIFPSRNSTAASSSIGCSTFLNTHIFCSSSSSVSRSSRRVPERLMLIDG